MRQVCGRPVFQFRAEESLGGAGHDRASRGLEMALYVSALCRLLDLDISTGVMQKAWYPVWKKLT